MKKLFIILITIIAITMTYLWFTGNRDYKQKIETIKKERDSIKVQYAFLENQNDSLKNLEPEIKRRTIRTKLKLKTQEDETNAIPGIVATYPDSKLDSILTNHRHTPRAKGRDSINP